jgi:hypothetical protein
MGPIGPMGLIQLHCGFGLGFVYALVDLYRPGGRLPFPRAVFHFYGQASRPISTGKLNTLL